MEKLIFRHVVLKKGKVMKLSELNQIGDLRLINEIIEDKDIQNVYIGDLLSFVMANGKEGSVWVTVQRHINVIAVAELNDFAAIVFVENVEPDEDTLAKANELHIPLLTSSLDAFALCKQLYQAGL